MALSSSSTATDIVAAIESDLSITLDANAKALWTAIIGALYTRIKADMVVASTVATAIPVATTGTAAAQTGATTAPGTATSNTIS